MKRGGATKVWWILGGFTVVVCGICGFGGCSLYRTTFGRYAQDLPNQLAAAKAEGIPLEPADLRAMTKVPPEENAAPLYRRALQLAAEPAVKKDLNAISAGTASLAKVSEVKAGQEALGRQTKLIALVESAAGKPKCDFDKQWELGPNVLFPELAQMKSFSKLLAAEADRQIKSGDAQGAFHSLDLARHIAAHVAASPSIIGMLVSIALQAIADHEAFKIIKGYPSNPAVLKAATAFYQSAPELRDFRYYLGGEVVMGRITIHSLHNMKDVQALSSAAGDGGDRPPALPSGLPMNGVQAAFEDKLLSHYRTIFSELPKDPYDVLGASAVMERADRRLEASHGLADILNQILLPVFSQAAEARGRTLAQQRVAIQTLTMLNAVHAGNPLPSALPLAGASAIDPFDGKPLRYAHWNGGFRVYSVDRDKVDDGGVPVKKDGESKARLRDIVLEIKLK